MNAPSYFFLRIPQIALVSGFWSGFLFNFITGVLATVVVSFVGWLIVRLTRGARQLLKARGRYRINRCMDWNL